MLVRKDLNQTKNYLISDVTCLWIPKNKEIIINIFSWDKTIKKIMGACVAKEKEGGNVRRKNNNCILSS